ncbi:phospholipase B1, membrane-associated-like [Musca vetustissima]|uniref:phospholipase B1, membrane-associated-like n=1 Tax=Musca vetustissima TaxID=27455 RepID=UPI002AB78817|nr:phospholipase B1, membrane-associated-like [Musca vetustissima]
MKPIHILTLSLLTSLSAVPEIHGQNDIDYFLKISGIEKTSFHPTKARNGKLLVTNLDESRDVLLNLRRLLLQRASKNWSRLYNYNWISGKIQRPRRWDEFPCPLNGTRSKSPPTTLDKLRPGDIDVIAAIGDSLTAGNGAISETLMDVATEYRGVTFSGGGVADWRTILTLPNILKVFNPNLYGFSTQDGVAVDREAYLNIAEPMVMSRDLVYQVRVLIQRMRQDPKIDMQRHWKLLTIFVGNNDICSDMCHHDNLWNFLRQHEEDLRQAFTLLRENIPRLVVNLIPAPNMVNTLRRMQNIPLLCQAVHSVGCHCVFSETYSKRYLQNISKFISRWQKIDEYVASLPEFYTKEFVVLYQSFTANVSLPILENGDTDLRFLASDCFHFSQLGHAAVANELWNNMLQAPGQKESVFREPFERFLCPTEERPYIATYGNSFMRGR